MPNSSNKGSEIRDLGSANTVSDYLRRSIALLSAAGIENADFDARYLIGHILGLDRAQLLTQGGRILSPTEKMIIGAAIDRRAKHESVARILGQRDFWKLSFALNEATLEPRPDSETLIESALKKITDKTASLRILDIGTGSGCLLLSLLHELPMATGLGLDIAPRAIEQAQTNATALGLAERCAFRKNSWLDGIDERFDIIISNPPYIVDTVIPTLSREVRNYDPIKALAGGKDGLVAYRHLIPQLPLHLKPGGFAVFEIGFDQGDAVEDLFKHNGFTTQRHKDLSGNDRCIIARLA